MGDIVRGDGHPVRQGNAGDQKVDVVYGRPFFSHQGIQAGGMIGRSQSQGKNPVNGRKGKKGVQLSPGIPIL